MRGHKLPGPNQRSALKMFGDESMLGNEKTTSNKYSMMMNRERLSSDESALEMATGNVNEEGMNADELKNFQINSMYQSRDSDPFMKTSEKVSSGLNKTKDDVVKKNVDVEVTVNGQQV